MEENKAAETPESEVSDVNVNAESEAAVETAEQAPEAAVESAEQAPEAAAEENAVSEEPEVYEEESGEQPAEESEPAEEANAKKAPAKVEEKPKKKLIAVTYALSVLFIIAGLFLPLFHFEKGGDVMGMMMFTHIPNAINRLLAPFMVSNVLPASEGLFKISGEVYGGAFDGLSLIVLLYALVCVLSIVMLIPVLAGKKEKRTSEICAYIVEIPALILAAAYVVYHAIDAIYMVGGAEWTAYAYADFNMPIVLALVLITTAIQSIATKKSVGVYKLFGAVLSILATLMILSIPFYVSALTGSINYLSNALMSGTVANLVHVSSGTYAPIATGLGIDGIGMLVNMSTTNEAIGSADAYAVVVYILMMGLSVMVLINLAMDLIGLSTGRWKKKDDYCSNLGANTVDIIRYAIAFMFAAALLVLCILIEQLTCGIYLYFLLLFLAAMLILSIVRTAEAHKRRTEQLLERAAKKPEEEAEEPVEEVVEETYEEPYAEETYEEPYVEETYEEPVVEETYEEPAPAAFVEEEPAPEEEPVVEEPAPEEEPVVEEPTPEEEPAVDHFIIEDQTPAEEEESEPFIIEDTSEPEPEPEFGNEPFVVEEEPAPFAEPAAELTPTNEEEEQLTFPMNNAVPYSYSVEPQPQPQPQPQPEAPTPTYYVYSGVTDPFMDTLTDNEKVEFVETFLKKNKGTVKGVPDYEINGDNDDFFSSVFVHLNRVRPICSDELLGKIYNQIGR